MSVTNTETEALGSAAVDRLLTEFPKPQDETALRRLLLIAWCDGRLDGLARWGESLEKLRPS